MKRWLTVMCIIALTLGYTEAFAGPFGLKMGMSVKQVKAVANIKETDTFLYTAKKVPKAHNAFDTYLLTISPKNGLCKITAVGKVIDTSAYGSELLAEFESMEKTLAGKYGANKKYDFLKSGSIWSGDNDWTMALKLNERVLSVYWDAESGSKLEDNLRGVSLYASALDQHTGYYTVSYEFNNFDACIAEVKKKEQDRL